MTQEPQPPYPHQPPPPPGAWGQPSGQQPVPQPYGYGQPQHQPQYQAQLPGQYPGPYAPPPAAPSGMYQAAAIINWVVLGLVVLGSCGFGIIAAAWFIPMTMAIQKGSRDRQKHTALAVCTLLFCNIVSGILMLVEDSNRPPRV